MNKMRSLLGYLFLCFISIQMTFGQTYLIDSSSILTLFGNISSSINFAKYTYDDQNRILQISSKFQVRNFVYSNDYDHSILTHNPQTNLFSPREDNYYNADGILVIQEKHAYDSQNQEYTLDTRKQYIYDQENRLIDELYYSYAENGDEYLINTYDFTYLDGKLVNRLHVFYVSSSAYSTTNTDYTYLGDNLMTEEYEKIVNGDQTGYFKDIKYNGDNTLKSFTTSYLEGIDTTHLWIAEYVHTADGIEKYSSYFTYSTDTYDYFDEYSSFVESPFYEKDTFINIIYPDGSESGSETRFNSTLYSVTSDSAFVRRENLILEPPFSSFQRIVKDLFIKLDSAPTEITEEDINIAHIYPSPSSASSTVIIQKIISDVDQAEIYNSLGQKIQIVNLKNKDQVIIQAPLETGSYFIVFSSQGMKKGKIATLLVQN